MINIATFLKRKKPKNNSLSGLRIKRRCPSCGVDASFNYLDNQEIPDGKSQPLYECSNCNSSFLLSYLNKGD